MQTEKGVNQERGFLSRKFLLAVLCLLTGFYLACTGICDLYGYTTLVTVILGAYNGSDTIKDFIFNRPAPPASGPKRRTK